MRSASPTTSWRDALDHTGQPVRPGRATLAQTCLDGRAQTVLPTPDQKHRAALGEPCPTDSRLECAAPGWGSDAVRFPEGGDAARGAGRLLPRPGSESRPWARAADGALGQAQAEVGLSCSEAVDEAAGAEELELMMRGLEDQSEEVAVEYQVNDRLLWMLSEGAA